MTNYAVAEPIDPRRLEANWIAVSDALDAPPATRLERALTFIGVPEPVGRLLLSAPTLRRAWWISVGLAMVFALTLDGSESASQAGYIALAPLVPVIGIALAYGPASDPSYESSLAAPMSGLRLLTIRAVGVLVLTAPLVAIAGLLLHTNTWLAAAWLLPGIALGSATMALSTWKPLRTSALAVVGAWALTVIISNNNLADITRLFGFGGQLLSVSILVASAMLAYVRRDMFEHLEIR